MYAIRSYYVICVGNVEITRGEWLGTSKKMVYLSKERQVILTGNAKAWQGQNMVSGEKIIYYLDEGRSEVVGGPVITSYSIHYTKLYEILRHTLQGAFHWKPCFEVSTMPAIVRRASWGSHRR